MNRLEGTSLATGRRGDVDRLQRTHAVGLARPRQRPELDRPQRAVTVHCHHSPSLQGRTPPLSLFRNVNARFLTRFNFPRPTSATKNRPLDPPNRRITHHKPPRKLLTLFHQWGRTHYHPIRMRRGVETDPLRVIRAETER